MAEKLDDNRIEEMLELIPEWNREGDKIRRSFLFDDFMAAIDFINRIAPLAETADHHPEIFNVYNRVDIDLTTHDADGLTVKDFDLAKKIDRTAH